VSRGHAARRPLERCACPSSRRPSHPRRSGPGQLRASRTRIPRLPCTEALGCPRQPRVAPHMRPHRAPTTSHAGYPRAPLGQSGPPPVRALQGRGEGVKPHTLLAAPIKGTAQPPHSRPCIHRPPLPPPRRAPRSEPRATNLSTLASPQLPSAASRAASLSRSCPSAPETPLQWPPPPGAAVRNRRHRFHPVSGPKSVHGEPLNLPRYSLTEVWRGIDGISDRTVASRSWRLHCDPTYCSRGLNARQGPVCKESKTSRDLFEICILNSDFSFVDSCKICRKS
jgi:hypothetical protein